MKSDECEHQYFEIKKLANLTKESEKQREEFYRQLKQKYLLSEIPVYESTRGVLVKCALCGQEKELWEHLDTGE